jgi:hypothetical protein
MAIKFLTSQNIQAGTLTVSTIANLTTASNTFLVSDGGLVKYRTAAEVLSDIGAGTGSVTSITITPGTGISGGGTITSSGTLTITNTDLGSSQAIFKNIAVAGESTIVADSNNDTLTFINGSNIAITTNATTDTITISASDTNNYPTSLAWDTATGILTLGRNGLSSLTVDLDNRYAELGTQVTNKLTKWNGSNVITESIIYDNGTNVGIGTTTPTVALQVNGSGSANNYRGVIRIINNSAEQWSGLSLPDNASSDANSSNYYFIGRGNSLANRELSFHIPTAANYGSGDQPLFRFASTGADNLMTIQAVTGNTYIKGNVGIGTTSPIDVLHVVGGISSTSLSNTLNGSIGSIQMGYDGTNGVIRTWNSSPIIIAAYNYQAFETTGAERMRIATSGNVLIGTTSGSFPLTVVGKIGANIFGDSYLEFPSNGHAILKANNDVFVGYSQNFVVKQNGYVGVGTTNPLYRLESTTTALFGTTAYGVLNIAGDNPAYIKIKTNIPFSYGAQGYTVNIKGFQYGSAQTLDLQVCWHQYADAFTSPTITSKGSFAPVVRLARENGLVVIVLTWGQYWPKLYVESVHNYINDGYANGWTWVDENVTGDKTVTLSYKNDFGDGFVKTAAGLVGIGTSNPTKKLDVIGQAAIGSGAQAIVGTDGTYAGYSTIGFGGTTNGYNRVFGNNGTGDGLFLAAATSQGISFWTNGANNRMYITSSGNVLINTTTDSGYKLDVNGTARVSGQVVSDTKFFVAGTPNVNSGDLISVRDLSATGSNTTFGGVFFNSSPGNDYSIGKLTENSVGFLQIRNGNNGAELLRIGSTGVTTITNLAGTGSRMVVADASGVLSTQAIPTGTVTGTGTTNYISKWTSGSALANSSIVDDGAGNVYVYSRLFQSNGTNQMIFGQWDGVNNRIEGSSGLPMYMVTYGSALKFGVGGDEKAQINSSGNLLIGTTTDAGYKLDVNGSIKSQGILFEKSPYETRSIGLDTYGWYFYNNTDSRYDMLIDASGNVGIGTTSPGAKLEVNGNIKLSGAAGATSTPSYIWLGNDYSNGVTRDKLKIYLYNSGVEQYGFTVGSIGDVQYHSNAFHDFYTNNSLSLRINSSGNVGIGTTIPNGKLNVVDTLNNGTYGAVNITNNVANVSYGHGLIINVPNFAVGWGGNTNYSLAKFMDAGGDAAWIGGAQSYFRGNVGIGTTTPATKLEVVGGYISTKDDATYGGAFMEGANGIAYFGSLGNDVISLYSGGAIKLQIKSNGNTLIGTTTDSGYKFYVNGNVSFESGKIYTVNNANGNSLDIYNHAGTGANAWRHIYGGSGTGYGVGVGGYGIYYNGNSGYNQINFPNGDVYFGYNVGIGTNSPIAKLTVNELPVAELGSTSYGSAVIHGTNYNLSNTQRGIVDINYIDVAAQDNGSTLTFTNNAGMFGYGYSYVGVGLKAGKENSTNQNQATYFAISTNSNSGFAERFRISSTGAATFSSSVTTGGDIIVNNSTNPYSSTNRGAIFLNGVTNSLYGFGVGGVAKGYLYHEGTNMYFENTVSGGFFNIVQVGAGYIGFQTNGSEKMRLNSSGQLLLGTSTSSSYLLDVNGDTRVTGTLLAVSAGGQPAMQLSGNNPDYAQLKLINTNGYNYAIISGITSLTNAGFSIRNITLGTDILTLAAAGAATFSSSVTATNFIVPGGTSAQFLKADGSLDSNVYLTSTSSTFSYTSSVTLSPTWQNTGVSSTNLGTGTYLVNCFVNDHAVGGEQYSCTYAGIMYFYAGGTNGSDANEIVLHHSGHADQGRYLYLRTLNTYNTDGKTYLQISGNGTNSGASNYQFTFKKLL